MQNGYGRESGRCVELGFSEGNCLVGVVTSRHVTKMVVTPFDLQLQKTPCYRPTQTSRLYLLYI